MKKDIALIETISAVLFLFSAAHATVWYVHPDSSLNTIQAGLDYCSIGDTVLVAAGTYYENLIWPNTQGIDFVSESGPAATVIDGDSAGSVITISTSTYLDTTSKINGFTIRNGSSSWGGGICCDISGVPMITNNIIINNSADYGGGGICSFGSRPIITSNIITYNSAIWGGGILCYSYHPTIANNIITSNTGDGIECTEEASPTITGNTITGNTGHGIDCDECCNPTITDNIITDNTGNGIFAIDASPTIHNCTISGNGGNGVLYTYGMKCTKVFVLDITYSDITDNIGYGVRNLDSTVIVSAENNWWGDSSGPSGVGPGTGDEVSGWVDYEPWLFAPFGIEEQLITRPVENCIAIRATIFNGPLQLPEGKKCKVFDITGRVVEPSKIQTGIYFIEIDGVVTQKVVKVR